MGRWTIPSAAASQVLREGAAGIAVWSLQRALNDVGSSMVIADGNFGAATKASVIRFQEHVKVADPSFAVDGIAGNGTQKHLAQEVIERVQGIERSAPGLLSGFAEGEGGWWLDAVNWSISRKADPTLPLEKSGADCGLFQRRVYEVDWSDDAVIERAFDTSYQADLLAKSLVNLRSIYLSRPGTNDHHLGMAPKEKAWRLAALNHNYPVAADRLSRTPIGALDSYWWSSQAWVIEAMTWTDSHAVKHRVAFPSGRLVSTPMDWCHLYCGILGAGMYGTKGSVTRFVSVWP